MKRSAFAAAGVVLALGIPACKKSDQAPKSAPSEAAPEPESPTAAPAPPPALPAEPSTAEKPADVEEQKPKAGPSGQRGGLLQGPQTLAEAQAELDRAERDLKTLLGPTTGAGATPLASGDNRCPNACKAFASLERAADAVCRLAGETDNRCTRAKQLVKENKTRVSVCQCA